MKPALSTSNDSQTDAEKRRRDRLVQSTVEGLTIERKGEGPVFDLRPKPAKPAR
jgi:hypothetical protein